MGPDHAGSQTRGGQNFKGAIVTVKRTQLTIAIMGGGVILRKRIYKKDGYRQRYVRQLLQSA